MLEQLLSTPSAQLGRASRFLVFQIKLWTHCIRLLRVNRAGQQAAALSYQTIFGIVPLAIVTLLVFQGLDAYSDMGDKIKNFIYDQANLTAFESSLPGSEGAEQTVSLTEHLDTIIGKFFTGASRGIISLVSVLFVIWAAFALLSTIEKAFNNIFHVGKGRGFVHRMINYWAVLTLGPLLAAVGIYVTTKYVSFGHIQGAGVSEVVRVGLSFLVAALVLFLLYFVLPNTRVQTKAAVWGAVIGAVVWVAAKNIYGYSVTELGLYRTVYGVLALIPVTVLWIYITWLIVLFGLQVTFTTQHLTSLDAGEMTTAKQREEHFIANDVTVINIVREIAGAFARNEGPLCAETICGKLDLPGEFGEKIFDHLVKYGLIAKTSEPTVGYIPAKDPANIRLSDISAVVSSAGFAQGSADEPGSIERIARSQRELLGRYSLKQVLEDEQASSSSGRASTEAGPRSA